MFHVQRYSNKANLPTTPSYSPPSLRVASRWFQPAFLLSPSSYFVTIVTSFHPHRGPTYRLRNNISTCGTPSVSTPNRLNVTKQPLAIPFVVSRYDSTSTLVCQRLISLNALTDEDEGYSTRYRGKGLIIRSWLASWKPYLGFPFSTASDARRGARVCTDVVRLKSGRVSRTSFPYPTRLEGIGVAR